MSTNFLPGLGFPEVDQAAVPPGLFLGRDASAHPHLAEFEGSGRSRGPTDTQSRFASEPVRAALCKRYVGPGRLVLEDVPSMQPTANDLFVQMLAAAVNLPDTLIIESKYPIRPALPFSPGGEVADIVKTVGGEMASCAPSDRVTASCGWGGFALVFSASGGAGVSAVEAGNLVRARVIAAAFSADKSAFACSHGVYATIDYSKEDLRENSAR